MNVRRDAVAMLRALPAVFDLRDVEAYLEISRATASIYCSRWSKRKLIAPLGPRAGVFFNLIVDPDGPNARIHEAVHKRIRLPAVAVGAFALHQHGWTTQRPHLIELALPLRPTSRTLPKMDGIETVLRTRAWFHAVVPLCIEGVSGFALPPPEYALIDAISARRPGSERTWRPTASDIDLPPGLTVAHVAARMERAAIALSEDVQRAKAFALRIGTSS